MSLAVTQMLESIHPTHLEASQTRRASCATSHHRHYTYADGSTCCF
jgi:hypothetical protein